MSHKHKHEHKHHHKENKHKEEHEHKHNKHAHREYVDEIIETEEVQESDKQHNMMELIQEQAKHVDAIVTLYLDHSLLKHKLMNTSSTNTTEFATWNKSWVGNIAYACLHHKDSDARDHAFRILRNYHQWSQTK